jgi:hypothetical protein
MEPFSIVTLLFLALIVATLAAVVAFVLLWNSEDRASALIDGFLSSGRANPNASDVPPTYTDGFLDDPGTQRRKYDESQTTTQKELRALQ